MNYLQSKVATECGGQVVLGADKLFITPVLKENH